jgi:hypothetical protein
MRDTLIRSLLAMAGLMAGMAHAEGVPPEQLVRQAFVYSFPLHEMGALRLSQLGDGARPGATTLGHLRHARTLAGPADRAVTTPNNDTLYSLGWVDLAAGPQKLSLPDTKGRYYSVALIDAYTDNIEVLGRRQNGTNAAEFVLVGPRWNGTLPEGSRVVRATTDDMLVLVRLLVDRPDDAPAVHALQDQLGLTPLQTAPAGRPLWQHVPRAGGSAAERYLTIVNEMLERNPPPAYESSLIEKFAAVGVCGARCSWAALSPQMKALWEAQIPKIQGELAHAAPQTERSPEGWTITGPNIGRFGTHYGLRAAVALSGLLALPPFEAMYPSTRVDQKQQPLDGSHRYRLHLPPGGVPVNAFWSMTMYELEGDGRLFLAENPISRYSIGDRTRGLQRNADGSMDLWIQRERPDAAHEANWLPTPHGPFVLLMRAYQPTDELLDGRWRLPAVERLD